MAARRTPPYLVVLVAGSAITAIALGARSTMGIFLDPVSDGLGLGTGTFALMVAVQNLVWGLGQPQPRWSWKRDDWVTALAFAPEREGFLLAAGGFGSEDVGLVRLQDAAA